LINVPVALATGCVVPRLIAESRVPGRRGFDLGGAVAVTAGMTTLVYTVVKAPDYGWRSVEILALLGAGLVLLGAFAIIERRSASPLIPAAGFEPRPCRSERTRRERLIGRSGRFCSALVAAVSVGVHITDAPDETQVRNPPLSSPQRRPWPPEARPRGHPEGMGRYARMSSR
jgi:hypothetical protein